MPAPFHFPYLEINLPDLVLSLWLRIRKVYALFPSSPQEFRISTTELCSSVTLKFLRGPRLVAEIVQS